MVDLLKINGRGSGGELRNNILYPKNLIIIVFPPLLILGKTYRSRHDLMIAFFQYFAYIYERIIIWKAAIRNHIFIL